MDDWHNGAQTSSPDSIVQAVVLGLGAVLLIGGLVLLRHTEVLSFEWPEAERTERPCRT